MRQPTTFTTIPHRHYLDPVEVLRRRLVPDLMWMLIDEVVTIQGPVRPQGGGRPRADAYDVFVAVAYVLSSGCAWRRLPEKMLGVTVPTTYRRFVEMCGKGTWKRLKELANEIEEECEREWLMALVQAAEARYEER